MRSFPRIGESLGILDIDILYAEETRRRGGRFEFRCARVVIRFQHESDDFFESFAQFFHRCRLGIASREFRNRTDVQAIIILLDEYFEMKNLSNFFHINRIIACVVTRFCDTIEGMSAEKQRRSPVKLHIPEAAGRMEKTVGGKPLEMSLETANASLDVARDAASGKEPSADHVEKLAESVEADLKQLKKDSRKNKEQSINTEEVIQNLPSFKEIFATLDAVEKTYATPAELGKIKRAGALMVGLEVLQGAGQVAQQMFIEKVIGDKDYLGVLGEMLGRWRNRDEKFDSKSFSREVLKKTAGLWAPVALNLISDQTVAVASKDINKALEAVGNRINKRTTESLFMQEYAFVQDIPPAEVLNIIERGKMATVDLIATMRADVYPAMARTVSSLMPAYQINPIATALSAIRIWPLYEGGKKQIKTMIRDRGSINVQAEQIDTTIASLLTNLEIAKAQGKSSEVAQQLQEAMKAREELYTSQRNKKVTQDRWEKLVNFFFDKATPAVVTAWEYMGINSELMAPIQEQAEFEWSLKDSGLLGGDKNEYKKILGKLFADAQIRSVVYAAEKAREFNGIQQQIARDASRLTGLYVRNIMPDLQDIRDMEALLGPWSELDTPNGARENARKPVSSLKNLDISVKNLNVMGILNNVSFDIKQGDFVAIRADKGEGKTTLLRTMLGLYTPESGSVKYGGTDVNGIKKFGNEALHKQFGYSPQNSGFIETMTLKENLLLWNKDIPDEKIIASMQELGLGKLIPRLNEQGSHYSGGEKRLLTIVRALLTNPKVLYLDEPTANLDQNSIDRLVATLQTIRKMHPETTIIAVTHDADFAKHTDRTINLAELNKKPVVEVGAVPKLNDHQVLEAIARPKAR